jgi:hypothetical protein
MCVGGCASGWVGWCSCVRGCVGVGVWCGCVACGWDYIVTDRRCRDVPARPEPCCRVDGLAAIEGTSVQRISGAHRPKQEDDSVGSTSFTTHCGAGHIGRRCAHIPPDLASVGMLVWWGCVLVPISSTLRFCSAVVQRDFYHTRSLRGSRQASRSGGMSHRATRANGCRRVCVEERRPAWRQQFFVSVNRISTCNTTVSLVNKQNRRTGAVLPATEKAGISVCVYSHKAHIEDTRALACAL